jgi:hypothetical protein
VSVNYLNPPYKLITQMLSWQKQGLQQTASGYGRKLTTPYMLETPDGRKRRVYAVCFSNSASHYVLIKGERVFLRDGELETARDTGEVQS